VGARETDHVTQVVHEQQPWLDLMLVLVSVDSRRDLVLHTLLLSTPMRAAAPGTVPVNQAS
jgi:hypothetical protein